MEIHNGYIFISVYLDELVRSSDNGKSWQYIQLPDTMRIWDIRSSNNSKLSIAIDKGIFSGIDDGVNWIKMSYTEDQIENVRKIMCAVSGYLYLCSEKEGNEFYSIYNSADKGNSWIPVTDTSVFNIQEFCITKSNRLIFSSCDSVYFTDDFGKNIFDSYYHLYDFTSYRKFLETNENIIFHSNIVGNGGIMLFFSVDQGESIFKESLLLLNGMKNINFPTKDLPAEIYFIKLNIRERIIVKKFINL